MHIDILLELVASFTGLNPANIRPDASHRFVVVRLIFARHHFFSQFFRGKVFVDFRISDFAPFAFSRFPSISIRATIKFHRSV